MGNEDTFTAKDVVSLTGIPHSTLNTWLARGILRFRGHDGWTDPPSQEAQDCSENTTPGVARRYTVRDLFELKIIAFCLKNGYTLRVAAAIGRTMGNYSPDIYKPHRTGYSPYYPNYWVMIVGSAWDDRAADVGFVTERVFRVPDQHFTPENMAQIRERYGDCILHVLPLSLLQEELLTALGVTERD